MKRLSQKEQIRCLNVRLDEQERTTIAYSNQADELRELKNAALRERDEVKRQSDIAWAQVRSAEDRATAAESALAAEKAAHEGTKREVCDLAGEVESLKLALEDSNAQASHWQETALKAVSRTERDARLRQYGLEPVDDIPF